jgi:hypothetical protein
MGMKYRGRTRFSTSFFRACVTRYVHWRIHAAVDDIGAAFGEVIHHPEDPLFVAWDDARAQYNCVAAVDR